MWPMLKGYFSYQNKRKYPEKQFVDLFWLGQICAENGVKSKTKSNPAFVFSTRDLQ